MYITYVYKFIFYVHNKATAAEVASVIDKDRLKGFHLIMMTGSMCTEKNIQLLLIILSD